MQENQPVLNGNQVPISVSATLDAEGLYTFITTTRNFELAVSMGLIDGFWWVDKFGVNLDVSPSTDPEDIIEFGGSYNYDPVGTAPIQFLSCSESGYTGNVKILGQDINRNEVELSETCNGQNNVTLSTALWRVYRIENDDNATDPDLSEGETVYVHTDPSPSSGVPDDSNIRAAMSPKNQTLMAVYTIPKGKVGFLYRGELGLELEGNAGALAEFGHCHYESRRLGKKFKVKKAVTLIVGGASTYVDVRMFPDPIPSGTDIKLVADNVSQAMGFWGTFDILMVDEDKLTPEFLAKIGQPT